MGGEGRCHRLRRVGWEGRSRECRESVVRNGIYGPE